MTRRRRPRISSPGPASSGSFSHEGKTSGITPAKVATSSRKSSTSLTWARTISKVRGACNPSAAVVKGPADPQAPSIVALWLFLSAAMTSGNPGARWICRVNSRSSRPASGAFFGAEAGVGGGVADWAMMNRGRWGIEAEGGVG